MTFINAVVGSDAFRAWSLKYPLAVTFNGDLKAGRPNNAEGNINRDCAQTEPPGNWGSQMGLWANVRFLNDSRDKNIVEIRKLTKIFMEL